MQSQTVNDIFVQGVRPEIGQSSGQFFDGQCEHLFATWLLTVGCDGCSIRIDPASRVPDYGRQGLHGQYAALLCAYH